MHWHAPYNYWQWPWEQHQRAPISHRENDVANPTWVRVRRGESPLQITPTDEMVAQYRRALAGPTIEFHAYENRRRNPLFSRQQFPSDPYFTGQRSQSADYIREQLRQNIVNSVVEERNRLERTASGLLVPAGALGIYSVTERRFGVEIECISNPNPLVDSIRAKGIAIERQDYNHRTQNYWKIVSDGSLRYTGSRQGFHTMELVSPPMQGPEGLQQLKHVCDSLLEVNTLVNTTCGLHVHHDAADFNVRTASLLAKNYMNSQGAIDKILSESRRSVNDPTYCHPIRSSDIRSIEQARSWGDLYLDRYRVVNLMAYMRHKTIEFRQHQGTVEFPKIAAWIMLGQSFMNKAIEGVEIQTTSDLDVVMSMLDLPDDVQRYFKRRESELARRTT